MNGVTDFIVAGPAGQTQAGPAGSFQAGPAGVAHVGQAGHVPIDTTPARVPIVGAGHVPIDTSQARIPYAPSQAGLHADTDTSGSIPLRGGGGGGGGFVVGGGGGTTGGGGGGAISGGPGSVDTWSSGIGGGKSGGGAISGGVSGGGGGAISGGPGSVDTWGSGIGGSRGGGGGGDTWSSGIGGGTSGGGAGGGGGGGGGTGGGGGGTTHVISPNTGGSSHYTPGGEVPVSTGSGQFIPVAGTITQSPGQSHFTPGGEVPVSTGSGQFVPITGYSPQVPNLSHYSPSGHVPIDTATGGHYIPGGSVPMTPKVGIDPNMPHARVNPPRPGRVYPHEMSQFHGPRNVHVQNWPRDEWSHVRSTRAWEPKDTRSTWEPPKQEFQLSTDLVDPGALMATAKTNVLEGLVQPRHVETSYDFSRTVNQDQSTTINQQSQNTLAMVDQSTVQTIFNDNRFLDNSQSTARAVLQDFSADRVVNTDLDILYANNADMISVLNTDIAYTVANEPTYQFDMSRDVTLYFMMAPERAGGALVAANG